MVRNSGFYHFFVFAGDFRSGGRVGRPALQSLKALKAVRRAGQFFERFDPLFRSAGLVAEHAEFFFTGVEHDDGWETLDLIFAGKRHVLLFQGVALRLVGGEIEFHKDEVLGGIIDERLARKNLLVELDAPVAPVGAGEIKQQPFFFGGGLLDGGGVVRQPDGLDLGGCVVVGAVVIVRGTAHEGNERSSECESRQERFGCHGDNQNPSRSPPRQIPRSD